MHPVFLKTSTAPPFTLIICRLNPGFLDETKPTILPPHIPMFTPHPALPHSVPGAISTPGCCPVTAIYPPPALLLAIFCPAPVPASMSPPPWVLLTNYSSVFPLSAPDSTTVVSSCLPPCIRSPVQKPTEVGICPLTAPLLPTGGLCTWLPTASQSPVSLPPSLVSPTPCIPD